ncbi:MULTISPECIES: N-acetylglucosamine-6-phosphate deacetylase [Aerococcus]|nr:N-acetylglucosamine-6-phosphate deacetylase [Aerococcus loyolae]OFL16904.1 N-acetylglucosamine-6-phosphate deacetylase [Aerococcus loyolae]
MMKYIKAKAILLADHKEEEAYLIVNDDGTFGQVVKAVPDQAEVIDYSDGILAPGLVDTHIHGFHGYDVMDKDPEGIEAISKGLLSCGVTSWLPTTLTDTSENLTTACQVVAQSKDKVSGAKIRGIFFEGPFFTEEHKGAQNENYMSDPDIEKVKTWLEASEGLLNKIALAPERKGVVDFIPQAEALGVHISLGHSNATYDQAKAAVEAGAHLINHTYNGMSGLHHREPGLVGAALTLDNLYTELICDGFHVKPGAINVVLKARKKGEVVLITDCMRAGGMPEGPSMLGELAVIVKDGAARLVNGGNLAGSILTLAKAVENLVAWNLVSLEEAVQMASYNPAKSVGIEDQCGQIKAGLDADFIVLNEQGQLQATYLNGKKVY